MKGFRFSVAGIRYRAIAFQVPIFKFCVDFCSYLRWSLRFGQLAGSSAALGVRKDSRPARASCAAPSSGLGKLGRLVVHSHVSRGPRPINTPDVIAEKRAAKVTGEEIARVFQACVSCSVFGASLPSTAAGVAARDAHCRGPRHPRAPQIVLRMCSADSTLESSRSNNGRGHKAQGRGRGVCVRLLEQLLRLPGAHTVLRVRPPWPGTPQRRSAGPGGGRGQVEDQASL